MWIGVTVESNKYKKRIELLKKVNASIRFLSCEPLLTNLGKINLNGIDWVIVGQNPGQERE